VVVLVLGLRQFLNPDGVFSLFLYVLGGQLLIFPPFQTTIFAEGLQLKDLSVVQLDLPIVRPGRLLRPVVPINPDTPHLHGAIVNN
jgi:hypothetical protein